MSAVRSTAGPELPAKVYMVETQADLTKAVNVNELCIQDSN
jgi:hypothetical protein